MDKKINVAVLGATGMVGQRFIEGLVNHPWFEIKELCASERSAGKDYSDAVSGRWKIEGEVPDSVASIKVKECKPGLESKIVFSALDNTVAGPIEEEFAKSGCYVLSNAKNHRTDLDVPILVPEVNADHSKMIYEQQKNRGWEGFIVTNPNCVTAALTVALKPLHDNFGLEKVVVTTEQALSGAGWPGVASLDILDNVIPYIGGEIPKVESEPLKIMGKYSKGEFVPLELPMRVKVSRVGVSDGHMESIYAILKKDVTKEEVISAFENFSAEPQKMGLPSAPIKPTEYIYKQDRPQPRLDRERGNGMTVSIGQVEVYDGNEIMFWALGHNTKRGAALGSILNAEYLFKKGYMKDC